MTNFLTSLPLSLWNTHFPVTQTRNTPATLPTYKWVLRHLWKTVSEIVAIKLKRNEPKKKKTSYDFYYQTN